MHGSCSDVTQKFHQKTVNINLYFELIIILTIYLSKFHNTIREWEDIKKEMLSLNFRNDIYRYDPL